MPSKDEVIAKFLKPQNYIKRFLYSLVFFWITYTLVSYVGPDHPLPLVDLLTPNQRVFWRNLALAILLAFISLYISETSRRYTTSLILAKLNSSQTPVVEQPSTILATVRRGGFMGLGVGLILGLLGFITDTLPGTGLEVVGYVLLLVLASLAWTIPAVLLIRWMTTRKSMTADQQH